VSYGGRILIALIFLVIAVAAIGCFVLLHRKGLKFKWVCAAVALFAVFRGILTFIKDGAYRDKKGIAQLFINIPPEFGYAFAFAIFLSYWSFWLMRKRDVTPSSTSNATSFLSSIPEMFNDFITNIKTIPGIYFVFTILVAILFTLLSVVVGAKVDPINLSLYFTYTLIVFSSGIAYCACGLFGTMFPTKFFWSAIISLIPLLRLIFAFVVVMRSARLGDGNSKAVTALWIVYILIFEVVPVVFFLVGTFIMSRAVGKLSNKQYTEPMLKSDNSNVGPQELKLASALGFMLDDNYNADDEVPPQQSQ